MSVAALRSRVATNQGLYFFAPIKLVWFVSFSTSKLQLQSSLSLSLPPSTTAHGIATFSPFRNQQQHMLVRDASRLRSEVIWSNCVFSLLVPSAYPSLSAGIRKRKTPEAFAVSSCHVVYFPLYPSYFPC
jgi:hypothetical protein